MLEGVGLLWSLDGVDEQESLKQGVPVVENRPLFEEGMQLVYTAWA